jgi:hypothetical protein
MSGDARATATLALMEKSLFNSKEVTGQSFGSFVLPGLSVRLTGEGLTLRR